MAPLEWLLQEDQDRLPPVPGRLPQVPTILPQPLKWQQTLKVRVSVVNIYIRILRLYYLGLTAGQTAGVAVGTTAGSILLIAMLGLGVFCYRKKRRRPRRPVDVTEDPDAEVELVQE